MATTQATEDLPVLLTRHDLSRLIGISAGGITRMVQRGQGPPLFRFGKTMRLVRFDLREVRAWLAARHVPGDGETVPHPPGKKQATDRPIGRRHQPIDVQTVQSRRRRAMDSVPSPRARRNREPDHGRDRH